ncbi:hypothetical protein SKC41_25730 [Mycobacterium sp. 050128]|uniref:hypothetical protein n=1 Tax=Mycobacterium sp. 050128 TaxID=3096112 RepID=UPI002EDAB5D8
MRSASSHAIESCATAPPGQIDCAHVMAPSTPQPPTAAKAIVRRRYLRSQSLQPGQRAALVDRLYAIYSETMRGCTSDEFERLAVFGAGEVRLALFYGAQDELAGFCYASTEKIEHCGRIHAALCGGMFFRPGYHGGASGALFLLREGLITKLRNPRLRVGYMTRCTTAAVYRRFALTMPRLYPSRTTPTPAHVEALVRALGERRHYVPVGEGPWVVRGVGVPRDVSRLRRLDHEPDVRFYAELNPGFAEGDALVVWVHGDLADLARGFVRALRARLAR